ncbi:MAG: hypothetical protein J7623_20960 [Chitinophaga sp.]|uniref:DUF6660 family protein n=1 Tax=Chitinophaga sp. TaxID=1869181 RepID=UPI001AFE050E|nr:DUF6660 family protein [Chitinophaga sp.]MBO9731121.1 hypothetical protein [Chitinophaga sp.]
MKWLLYIFSCYLLLLSCMPCTDNNGMAGSSGVPSALLSTSHNHESSQPDFCSPLCICSCCNVQVTPGAPLTVYFHVQQAVIDYPVMPVNPLPSSFDKIWQPPQLV